MRSTSSSNHNDTVENLVIGSGLSGLAMAAEFHRNELECCLISSPQRTTSTASNTSTTSMEIIETNHIEGWKTRGEIIRHLETYTRTHKMDIRKNVHLESITPVKEAEEHNGTKVRWIITTDQGTLFARNIIMAIRTGSLPQFSHFDTIDLNNETVPGGLFVIGRTIGYGKAGIKEILAQVRRILHLIKEHSTATVL